MPSLNWVPVFTALALAGCGGSSDNPPPAVVAAPPGSPSVAATSCYDGGVANVLAAEDPFYENSWALKNTGNTQFLSAVINNGVTGIDANVELVHKAGKGCTGKGVSIAIIDSGLEIGHEDLVDNVLVGKSFNFTNNSNDPSPAPGQDSADQGTSVAGVAAARGWNGKGSRGMAPFASLLGFNMLSSAAPASGTTYDDMIYLSLGAKNLADAKSSVVTTFGDRADFVAIFNYGNEGDFAAPPVIGDLVPVDLAVRFGITNLRGGLGAIYLQGAGDEFTEMLAGQLPDARQIKVDCSGVFKTDIALLGGTLSNRSMMSCGSSNHDPSGKPYLYQIAAINNAGKASGYSSSGASNWVTGFGGEDGVAQAAMISADNSGCSSGSNNKDNKFILELKVGQVLSKLLADLFGAPGSKDPNCNYTGTVEGTTVASASVAGVVALILEANPKLTWQDVGYVLAKTARKVDAGIASGANKVNFFPDGASAPWNIEDPWIVNSAGFNFQNRYGFGLIDANAAVKLAGAYAAPKGRRAGNLIATGTASTNSGTSPAGVNTSTINFGDATAVSGPMRLDLTITNSTGTNINPGMLQFIVENLQTGTKSIVMPAFTSWYEGGKSFPIMKGAQKQFRFHTNAFYGEALGGSYKIYVVDFSGASAGSGKLLSFTPTLTSFSL